MFSAQNNVLLMSAWNDIAQSTISWMPEELFLNFLWDNSFSSESNIDASNVNFDTSMPTK